VPEGDSIANDARRLEPVLVGKRVESVYATSGSARRHATRIAGRSVLGVRTHGKNLVVDFEGGYSLRVHLAMNGRWQVLDADTAIPGPAKVALTTATHHAVCLAAPTVEVDRTPAIDGRLEELGPDLLDADFEADAAVARARRLDGEPLGRVLLNQRVAAGIGNVYKSEVAFLARVHPHASLRSISDEKLVEIYERARTLLAANVGPGRRTTTGNRFRGGEAWVYGREGKACRRCSSRIVAGRLDDRVSYWCSGCQPGEGEIS
jgi:endonuclease VIII